MWVQFSGSYSLFLCSLFLIKLVTIKKGKDIFAGDDATLLETYQHLLIGPHIP